MTYKEYFERLRFEYEQASKEFHKFKGRLSKTRQHKSGQVSKYSIAKYQFEKSSKAYWAFLNFWTAHKLDGNSELSADHFVNKVYSADVEKWDEAFQNYTFN